MSRLGVAWSASSKERFLRCGVEKATYSRKWRCSSDQRAKAFLVWLASRIHSTIVDSWYCEKCRPITVWHSGAIADCR